MRKQTFYINSTNETHKLHCIFWEMPETYVDGKPVAVVQIVHGMAEHINRYDGFAKFLASKGFFVVGHDHLGHGKSVRDESELGFFHNEKGGKYIIQDMHKIRKSVERKYNDIPYYILGHSMGSFCLRNYISVYGDGVKGAIIMGTGQVPATLVASGRTFLNGLEKVNGSTYRSNIVDSKIFKDYNKDIENLRTSKDWLTRDEAEVDKFIADPLCDFHFTLRAYDDFLSILGYIAKTKNFNKIPKDLRILVISGDKDPVGKWGRDPEKVAEMFINNDFNDVTLKLYKDARHEVLNEINKSEVYNDILNWLS